MIKLVVGRKYFSTIRGICEFVSDSPELGNYPLQFTYGHSKTRRWYMRDLRYNFAETCRNIFTLKEALRLKFITKEEYEKHRHKVKKYRVLYRNKITGKYGITSRVFTGKNHFKRRYENLYPNVVYVCRIKETMVEE